MGADQSDPSLSLLFYIKGEHLRYTGVPFKLSAGTDVKERAHKNKSSVILLAVGGAHLQSPVCVTRLSDITA